MCNVLILIENSKLCYHPFLFNPTHLRLVCHTAMTRYNAKSSRKTCGIYRTFRLLSVCFIFKEETPPWVEVEFDSVISSSSICMCMTANWFGLGLVSGSLNSIAANEPQGRRITLCIHAIFPPSVSFFGKVWKLKVYLHIAELWDVSYFFCTFFLNMKISSKNFLYLVIWASQMCFMTFPVDQGCRNKRHNEEDTQQNNVLSNIRRIMATWALPCIL